MRYSKDHIEATRAGILAGAGRAFRRHGRAGVGVDGLAQEAGVTSGAFYTHFESKDKAFEAAVIAGMQELLAGIRRFRAEHGEKWLDRFIGWYLGVDHRKDMACGCALVTLSPEVMRGGTRLRLLYTAEFGQIVDEIADGLGSGPIEARRRQARSMLGLLAGSVTLARSMGDEAGAEEVSLAAMDAVRAIVGKP
jgi:AcrR family transcriptional regulator